MSVISPIQPQPWPLEEIKGKTGGTSPLAWSGEEALRNRQAVHQRHHTIYPLVEKAMATHSGTLAWKIPWTEEPGRLQSMGS